jgi:hypothetical protein
MRLACSFFGFPLHFYRFFFSGNRADNDLIKNTITINE